jgi:hypothetical protein
MEPITFGLCPECDACPEVAIDAEGVRIGEADNIVRAGAAPREEAARKAAG